MNIILVLQAYLGIKPNTAYKEHYYKENGESICYIKYGHGERSILFLHGWGLSKETWQILIKFFPEDVYTLFLIDLPGFGNSTIDKALYLEDYANILSKFMSSVGSKHITLIAHSFGGKIAAVLTSKYPDLIDKMILCDVNLTQATYFLSPLIRKLLPLRAKPNMQKTLSITHYGYDFTMDLERITIPVLLIFGKYDFITPPINAYKIKKFLTNANIIILPRSTHIPYIENNKDFIDVTLEFIKS